MSTSLKLMLFFWQVGLVDTFSLIQFCINTGSQYVAIVVDSVKTPVLDIHPYRTEFTYNSKMIIDNMFQEHTARRYLKGSAQKIKTVVPIYLAPMTSASTKVNTTGLIGWTCLGVGLISFTILGSLYFFQRAERKRWQNQNDEVVIDVIAFLSE